MLIYESDNDFNSIDLENTCKSLGVPSRKVSLWGRNLFLFAGNLDQISLIDSELSKCGLVNIGEFNSDSPLSQKFIRKEQSNIVFKNGLVMSDASTIFIGGPCAVESREQIFQSANELSRLGVKALRAGAFKPRTSLYSFQGLEYEGLKLLREAADVNNMLVVTEAKDASHIDAVIEYADIVQIGTKSMYVFDLLRRAGESGKPVILKRGFMTTIKEYLQALDVILATGNENVIMCERGLRTFETQTRFTLDLAGAALLKVLSHLPLIIDPSHTTGRRDIVAPLARAGVALGVEGLLVEIHPNPDKALSDREQAYPLDDVPELLNSLRRVAASVDRKLV